MAGALKPAPDEHQVLLRAHGLTRDFPGVRALDAVDFDLRSGEILAVMGENGAGKSTLIKVLTGVHRPSAGTIELDGHAVEINSPVQAQELGISTVYQEVNLIPALSVAENILLGRQPRRFGFINRRAMHDAAGQAMRRLDLDIDVTLPLESYSIATRQMIAIARALDVDARVLILDEPTSSLDARETVQLFEVMRRLRDQGMGIIFVTHFLDQVGAVADRVAVLRNGRHVATRIQSELPERELVSLMIGRELDDAIAFESPTSPTNDDATNARPVIRVNRVSRSLAVHDLDFEVHEGEIVGLAGLLGSGRTETARLLFGLDQPDLGTISIDGSTVRLRSPGDAMRRHLAMLPEDRRREGLFPDLSLRENLVIAVLSRRPWWRSMSRSRQRRLADSFIRSMKIATTDAEKTIRTLSGGNQQKVILARWLATEPRLLILDEPTRGVDVGARAEIETIIDSLRREGMAIVLISSELEEVVRDAQRIVVLRDRRQVATLEGESVSMETVVNLISGAGS